MRQSHTNPARHQRLSTQLMLLTALMLCPRAIECQSPPASPPPSPARSGGAVSEISAVEIFRRFASRVLLLTCDLSADEYALGSGVLVSADGLVVTNAHVVEGCRGMTATQITGASRRSYAPVLKYYDKKSDTAVLKIAGQGFDFFPVLASPARSGERVYAIGNPLGLTQTITEGIVSGSREDGGQWWIQHSAPISHGSSGGALISSQGQLLGINSWFPSEESQGLFFAVPASTLAGAYSSARALTGVLKFPTSPLLTRAQAPPDAAPAPTAPSLKETLNWLAEKIPLASSHYVYTRSGSAAFDSLMNSMGGEKDVNIRTTPVRFNSCTVVFDETEVDVMEKFPDLPIVITTRSTVPLGAMTGGEVVKFSLLLSGSGKKMDKWIVALDATSQLVLNETHESLHNSTKSELLKSATIAFYEESIADRVLEAFKHAAELCRNQEPF